MKRWVRKDEAAGPPASLSSFRLPPSSLRIHAASVVTDPPGRLVQTGEHAGPLCLRGLNQNAVNQTIAPGAVSMGKLTSNVVSPVFPSNFQSLSSAGGV